MNSKKYLWHRKAILHKHGIELHIVSTKPRKLDGNWTIVEEDSEAYYGIEMMEDLVEIIKETDEIQ